jgi:anion-transporting  ArsA/GET3 family ATPase
MLKFTTTDAAGQLHGIKILIYGRSGVGKTTLAGTTPDVLMLSAEAGVLVVSTGDGRHQIFTITNDAPFDTQRIASLLGSSTL